MLGTQHFSRRATRRKAFQRISPHREKEGGFICPGSFHVLWVVGHISLREELIPLAGPSDPLAATPYSTPGDVSFHLSLEEEECPSEGGNQPGAREMDTVKEI